MITAPADKLYRGSKNHFKEAVKCRSTTGIFWNRLPGVSNTGFSSITSQVADHLRQEIFTGRWTEMIPGRNKLAQELNVSPKTVESALLILESEKLILGQGAGKRRKISLTSSSKLASTIRIAFFDYDDAARHEEEILELKHKLTNAGHKVFSTNRTLVELKMDPMKVAKEAAESSADAWIVCAGSREVLSWFSKQDTPVFALYGRRRTLPIAGVGPDKATTARQVARHLIELGHKRIVLVKRRERRGGGGGEPERAIFEEMAHHGVAVGPYNMPEWTETAEGFHQLLDNLFQVTPPTAIFVDEAFILHAAISHLAQKGITCPNDVSLICGDPDPTFAWCNPSIAHIQWDSRPVIQRVLNWTRNISRGKEDLRQMLTKATFIKGGSIGPASQKK